jgi:hypothetical protein
MPIGFIWDGVSGPRKDAGFVIIAGRIIPDAVIDGCPCGIFMDAAVVKPGLVGLEFRSKLCSDECIITEVSEWGDGTF